MKFYALVFLIFFSLCVSAQRDKTKNALKKVINMSKDISKKVNKIDGTVGKIKNDIVSLNDDMKEDMMHEVNANFDEIKDKLQLGGVSSNEIFGNAVLMIHNQECNSNCTPVAKCGLDEIESDCPAIGDCDTCISNQVAMLSSCSFLCSANVLAATAACAATILVPPPGITWVGCMFGLVRTSCQPCMCSAIEKVSSKGGHYCNIVASTCGGCGNQVAEAAVLCLPNIEVPPDYAGCVVAKAATTSACKSCICSSLCAVSDKLCDAVKNIPNLNCAA